MLQRKLLLADDSVTIQKVVNLTFADEGIEVITVGDGDSALETMSQNTPDLVMADVSMPGLNGYQLCERIRQTDALKKTPVILLVGSFEPYDEAEAARVGASDFLTKPFQSIRQLVTKVTDLLNSSAAVTETQNGENSSAASGGFENADTIRNFNTGDINGNSTQFGDAGMDDELIQTNSASSFDMDETAKFETREVTEPEFDAKTQPLSADDLREFSFSPPPAAETEEFERHDSSEQQNLNQTGGFGAKEQKPEISAYSQPTRGGFEVSDEDDFLELPFDEEDWEEDDAEETSKTAGSAAAQEQSVPVNTETEAQVAQTAFSPLASTETAETTSAYQQDATNEIAAEEHSPVMESFPAQLSPEMIEAIAQRVVEKLSEKAVKDVAWEVVPQMADLIIKKMAEERLKQ